MVPVITIAPTPTAVVEDGKVEFSCFAIGKPSPMIRWEYDGSVVGNGNTLTIGI